MLLGGDQLAMHCVLRPFGGDPDPIHQTLRAPFPVGVFLRVQQKTNKGSIFFLAHSPGTEVFCSIESSHVSRLEAGALCSSNRKIPLPIRKRLRAFLAGLLHEVTGPLGAASPTMLRSHVDNSCNG